MATKTKTTDETTVTEAADSGTRYSVLVKDLSAATLAEVAEYLGGKGAQYTVDVQADALGYGGLR